MDGIMKHFEIRAARHEDAVRLAELCTQLGYPSTPQEVSSRFSKIDALPDQLILVAVDPSLAIVGWIHAFVYRVLESDPMVEIGGLVVDRQARNRGIGRALITAVEDWAISRKIEVVSLRSNSLRIEAHAFYHRLGYTVPKTQLVFRKNLRLGGGTH